MYIGRKSQPYLFCKQTQIMCEYSMNNIKIFFNVYAHKHQNFILLLSVRQQVKFLDLPNLHPNLLQYSILRMCEVVDSIIGHTFKKKKKNSFSLFKSVFPLPWFTRFPLNLGYKEDKLIQTNPTSKQKLSTHIQLNIANGYKHHK